MRPSCRMTVALVALGLSALAAPALALAQAPARAAATPAERDSLEQRVRVRMGQILKTQLGLTDDQMRQLQSTNVRIEARRRELFQQEREVRGQLRTAMRDADTTRGAEVSQLLDRLIAVQRQRVELLEAEQRELATFLTPMQRARYFGMEEQIRRRVMEMRDDRGGQRRPAPPVRGDGRRPGQGSRPPR